jgi:hypothetical protein
MKISISANAPFIQMQPIMSYSIVTFNKYPQQFYLKPVAKLEVFGIGYRKTIYLNGFSKDS